MHESHRDLEDAVGDLQHRRSIGLLRIAAPEAAGIDEIVIQPVIDPPTEMAEFAELTA
jgi:hypothetical protein